MNSTRVIFTFLFPIALIHALVKATLTIDESPTELSSTNITCGLHLAKSSIPGGGLGMFAGKSLGIGMKAGPSDVCHFLVGISRSSTIFQKYIWGGRSGEKQVSLLCPSFGALPNGHHSLFNMRQYLGTESDTHLHREEDHSAGSFTLIHDARAFVKESVVAGEELFLDYGQNYFKNRPEYKDVYYDPGEIMAADDVISGIASFAEKFQDAGTSSRKSAERRVLGFLKSMMSKPVAELLPDTFEEIRAIDSVGGVARNQLPKSIRSRDWLDEHGSCIDNLKPGLSRTKERGRGAFASRSIKKGDTVTVSPALHVFREKLEHSFFDDDGEKVSMTEQVINYCFGHPESPVLLWPYAPVVNLINHDRASSNVAVRWADESKQPDWWMDKEKRRRVIANDTDQYGGSGLMLEFVASKDIAKDEEVLLDYGDAWEKAWQEHSETWLPSDAGGKYTATHFYNSKTQHPVLRTVEEQDENPYPPNLEMKCILEYSRSENPYEDVVEENAEERTVNIRYVWKHPIPDPTERLFASFVFFRPCRIVAREASAFAEEEGYRYTVEVLNGEGQEQDSEVRPHEVVLAEGLPRSVIQFFDRYRPSDVYTKNAFRMPIGLPGDSFPHEWMQTELQKESQFLNKLQIRSFVESAKAIIMGYVEHQTDTWNKHVAYSKETAAAPTKTGQDGSKLVGDENGNYSLKTSLYIGNFIEDREADIPRFFSDLVEECERPVWTNSSRFLSNCLHVFRDIVHEGRCTTRLDSRFHCEGNTTVRLSGKALADENVGRLELVEVGEELIRNHLTPETINIVIIGAGPAGLSLSNTLANSDQGKDKFRILVFENRLERFKDGDIDIGMMGKKRPYSRDWVTEIASQIMCPIDSRYSSADVSWNATLCLVLAVILKQNSGATLGIVGLPINILETLLLLSSRDMGVKFLFDDFVDYLDLLRLVPNLAVFDGSGHRLERLERVGHRTSVSNVLSEGHHSFQVEFRENIASPSMSSRINWHESYDGVVTNAEFAVQNLESTNVVNLKRSTRGSSVLYPVTSAREAYDVYWLKVKNFVATDKPAMDNIRDMVIKKLSSNTHQVCRTTRADRPHWCGPFYYFETSNFYRDDIAALMKETDVGFATRAVLMSLTSEQYEALSIVLLEDSVRLLDINREDLFNVRHILEENGVGDVLTALTEGESNAVSSSAEISLFRYSPYTYTDPVSSPRGTLTRLLNHSDMAAFRIGDSLMSGDPVAATGLTRHLQIISDFVCALTDSCALDIEKMKDY